MSVAPRGLNIGIDDKFARSDAAVWTAGREIQFPGLVAYRGSGIKCYDRNMFESPGEENLGPQIGPLFPGCEVVGSDLGASLFSQSVDTTKPKTDFDFADGVFWNCASFGVYEDDYNNFGQSIKNLTILFDPETVARHLDDPLYPQSVGISSKYAHDIDGVYVQGATMGLRMVTGREALVRRVRNSRFSVPAGRHAIYMETETHYSSFEPAVDFDNVHISEGSLFTWTLGGSHGDRGRMRHQFGPRLFEPRQVTKRRKNGDPSNSWWIFTKEQQGQRRINEEPFMGPVPWDGATGENASTITYSELMNVERGPHPKGFPISWYTEKYGLAFNGLTLPSDGIWKGRKVETLPWLKESVAVRMTPEEAMADPLPEWEKTHGQIGIPVPRATINTSDERLGRLDVTVVGWSSVVGESNRDLKRFLLYVADDPHGERTLIYDSETPHPVNGAIFLPKQYGDGVERYYFFAIVQPDGRIRFEYPWVVTRPDGSVFLQGWHAFKWNYDPATEPERKITLVGDLMRDLQQSDGVEEKFRPVPGMGRPFRTKQPGTHALMYCTNPAKPDARYYVTEYPNPQWKVEGIAGYVYRTPGPNRQAVYQQDGGGPWTFSLPALWGTWGREWHEPASDPWFFLPSRAEVEAAEQTNSA
jgi:hypothetical protein